MKREASTFYVKSKVLPSIKKGVCTLQIRLDSTLCIQQTRCDCPAGVNGRRNHIAATMFMLEPLDENADKENYLTKEHSENVPCTSKPKEEKTAQEYFCETW